MGAYKCPTCRGNDIADGAEMLHCLGCGAELRFAPGPKVVLRDSADEVEPEPVEAVTEPAEVEPEAEPVEGEVEPVAEPVAGDE